MSETNQQGSLDSFHWNLNDYFKDEHAVDTWWILSYFEFSHWEFYELNTLLNIYELNIDYMSFMNWIHY